VQGFASAVAAEARHATARAVGSQARELIWCGRGWQQSRCIHRSKKHCDGEDGSRNRVEAKEREPDSDKRGKQGASKYGTTLLLVFFLSFFPFRHYVSLLSLLFISSHTHTLIALSLLFNFPMVIICS
jgi:hypothetical protein